MKIAVCSLSEFTHVSEILDVTDALGKIYDLRYFPGYHTKTASRLLNDHGIAHTYTFGHEPARNRLKAADQMQNTERVFLDYFFRHAELSLPGLIEKFRRWRPDLIFSHLRDYAGSTAADYFDIPLVTFGSHQSPWRIERTDPPFGSGQGRNAPRRALEIAWQFHHRFNARIDEVFNSNIRRPLGLGDLANVSTFHSRTLTLLSIPPFMSNKNSTEPPHVRFVGPQFTRRYCSPDHREQQLMLKLSRARRPRVLLAPGMTYHGRMAPDLIKTLQDFDGTIVVTGKTLDTSSYPEKVICGFFCDMNSLHRLCDVVITTGSGKSATDALRCGIPMLLVPCQGEQKENALALESLGAALTSKLSAIKRNVTLDRLTELIENPMYRSASRGLGSRLGQYPDACAGLTRELLDSIVSNGKR